MTGGESGDVRGPHSAAIDALFSRWDRSDSPGVNLCVVRSGQVVHRRGYGVANLENGTSFTPRTALRLGSTSKHLCAACALLLEDRGLLSLDDDVRRFVPELPDYGATITLRHLLTMTSGLYDGLNLLLMAGLGPDARISRAQILALAATQRRLMFAPGDDCSYSNTNYAIASLAIERASGLALADFMRRELFAPLGMRDTALVPQMTRSISRAARGYVPSPDGTYDDGSMLAELSGDGGVVSTLDDMTLWLANFRRSGLAPASGPVRDLRARLEAPTRLNDGRSADYRLGLNVSRRRGRLEVGHAGGMPGFLCDFAYFPEDDLGIVLFANVLDPTVLDATPRIADAVLGAPRTPAAPTERCGAASLPLGHYASLRAELIVEIAEPDGALTCYWLGEAHPLGTQGSVFVSLKRGVTLVLRRDGDAFSLETGCLPPVALHRVEAPAPRTREDLDEYAGTYRSVELGERHVVRAVDGSLEIKLESRLRALVWKRFDRVGGDLFTSRIDGEPSSTNVQVGFRRDSSGRVRAFAYHLARCRNVEFERVAEDGEPR